MISIMSMRYICQCRFPITHQRFIALHQLDDFHRLLVLVDFDRYVGKLRVEIFLGNRIVCDQQTLRNDSHL